MEPVLIPKLNVVKSLAADRLAGLILDIDKGQLLVGVVFDIKTFRVPIIY